MWVRRYIQWTLMEMSRRNIDRPTSIPVLNLTNKFRVVGEILKLQAPDCRLDSRRSLASKACGIIPCGVCVPNKHEALSHCCFMVGPTSKTMALHWNNIGSMSRVCWVCTWACMDVQLYYTLTRRPRYLSIIMTYYRPLNMLKNSLRVYNDVLCNVSVSVYWAVNPFDRE